MQQRSLATQEIYDHVMEEIKYSSAYKSKQDLDDFGNQLINSGHIPNGDKSHDEMRFDIKLALYSDSYLEMMRESYGKGVMRVQFFKHLIRLYEQATESPPILDRIELIYAVLRDISLKNSQPLFITFNHEHPRFHARIECEIERIGIRDFAHNIEMLKGDDFIRLINNYITPTSPKWKGHDLNEEEYHSVMRYLQENFEVDEIMGLTLLDNIMNRVEMNPYWAKQFDLNVLINRFRFTDIHSLFAGEENGIGFGFPALATHITMTKAGVCDETKALLKGVNKDLIKDIKAKGILAKGLLVELNWIDATEKRATLEQEIGL